MPDATFAAYISEGGDEQQRVIYRFELKDGKPTKLGDGTFGAVFKVFGPNETAYAAKLFYESTDETVIMRCGQEMLAKFELTRHLREHRLEELNVNLVLAEAWTQSFGSSDAYKALEPYFQSTALSVSDRVAVMPLYTCTLKELLEHGAPPNRLVGDTEAPDRGVPCYELLDQMRYRDRENAALPIVARMARALRALHAGKMVHHDIKPANVLVRATGDGTDFALADFGFIRPNVFAESGIRHSVSLGPGLASGTRHYRSLEQRDFFDVGEVDVIEIDIGKESGYIELLSRDRKFRDSIIEAEDSVVFFKDPRNVEYRIASVEHPKNGQSRVILERRDDHKPAIDQRTQAIFYKRQTLRTDLFGLGALLFDMLTAGQSPERFSDFGRSWDSEDVPVEMAVKRYANAIRGASTSDIARVFERARHTNDLSYPRPEVVRIMLKCMLSNTPDSYYRTAPSDPVHKRLTKVCDELDACAYPPASMTHVFWVGKLTAKEAQPSVEPMPPTWRDEMVRVQRETSPARRLVMAYKRLELVLKAVESAARETIEGRGFMFDLSPEGLQYGAGLLRAASPNFTDEKAYIKALAGESDVASDTLDADPFTPPIGRYQVRIGEAISAEVSNRERVRVIAADSLPSWSPLEKNDFISTYP